MTDLKNKLTEKMPKINLIPLKDTAVNTKTQAGYDLLMIVFEAGGWKWNYSR